MATPPAMMAMDSDLQKLLAHNKLSSVSCLSQVRPLSSTNFCLSYLSHDQGHLSTNKKAQQNDSLEYHVSHFLLIQGRESEIPAVTPSCYVKLVTRRSHWGILTSR